MHKVISQAIAALLASSLLTGSSCATTLCRQQIQPISGRTSAYSPNFQEQALASIFLDARKSISRNPVHPLTIGHLVMFMKEKGNGETTISRKTKGSATFRWDVLAPHLIVLDDEVAWAISEIALNILVEDFKKEERSQNPSSGPKLIPYAAIDEMMQIKPFATYQVHPFSFPIDCGPVLNVAQETLKRYSEIVLNKRVSKAVQDRISGLLELLSAGNIFFPRSYVKNRSVSKLLVVVSHETLHRRIALLRLSDSNEKRSLAFALEAMEQGLEMARIILSPFFETTNLRTLYEEMEYTVPGLDVEELLVRHLDPADEAPSSARLIDLMRMVYDYKYMPDQLRREIRQAYDFIRGLKKLALDEIIENYLLLMAFKESRSKIARAKNKTILSLVFLIFTNNSWRGEHILQPKSDFHYYALTNISA